MAELAEFLLAHIGIPLIAGVVLLFMVAASDNKPLTLDSSNDVALDFIIDCQPGCYSLVGHKLDGRGNVADGRRADWRPGSAFVTPPGLWHSHHNERLRPGPI